MTLAATHAGGPGGRFNRHDLCQGHTIRISRLAYNATSRLAYSCAYITPDFMPIDKWENAEYIEN